MAVKWTVPDSRAAGNSRGDVEEIDAEYGPRLLRTRYCILIGIGGGVILWGLASLPPSAALTAADAVIRHWPWLAAIAVGALIGGVVWAFLGLSRFFERYSLWPDRPAWLAGAASGVVFALELDSGLDPLSRFVELLGGPGPATVILLGVLTVAAVVRRTWADLDVLMPIAAGICVIAVLAGVGVRAIDKQDISAQSAGWAENFLGQHAFLCLLVVATGLQICLWVMSKYGSKNDPDLAGGATSNHGRYYNLTLAIFVVVDVMLVLYLTLEYLPTRLVETDTLSPAEAADALANERRTLLAVVAGIGAALTLVYTHLRHQLDRDSNATDRYTRAIDQLGSDELNVRLGGIYALGRLQRDSPADARTISEVLAAFVRESTQESSTTSVSPDVVAAIGVLGAARPGIGAKANLRSSVLAFGSLEELVFPRGADLRQADLGKSNLSSADLTAARMAGTTLSDAILSGANLTDAWIADTDLSNTNFSESTSIRVNFSDVTGTRTSFVNADLSHAGFSSAAFVEPLFSGASMNETNITRTALKRANFEHMIIEEMYCYSVNFEGASFQGSQLRDCRLYDVDLTDVDFRNCSLVGVEIAGSSDVTGANFCGADLRRCKLREVQATSCVYDAETIWPPGFDITTLGAKLRPLDPPAPDPDVI